MQIFKHLSIISINFYDLLNYFHVLISFLYFSLSLHCRINGLIIVKYYHSIPRRCNLVSCMFSWSICISEQGSSTWNSSPRMHKNIFNFFVLSSFSCTRKWWRQSEIAPCFVCPWVGKIVWQVPFIVTKMNDNLRVSENQLCDDNSTVGGKLNVTFIY